MMHNHCSGLKGWCIGEAGHDGPHTDTPLNTMQIQVAEFHQAMGCVRGKTPAIRTGELRARLKLEEVFETVEALLGTSSAFDVIEDEFKKWRKLQPKCPQPDLVEAVDGICDTLFVTFGDADALGINIAPYFDLVWQANMTKLTGPVDEHGKRGKPPGFVPPNEKIRELLIKSGWSGK